MESYRNPAQTDSKQASPSKTPQPKDKSTYQKLLSNFNYEDIRVDPEESIYEALQNRGLLREPNFPKNIGLHLVQEGELGLSLNSGKPEFLDKGGRHSLKSPLKEYLGKASITEKLITLGPIQIVTIAQGELGLSVKNGEYIILEPGRYILTAPHQFVKSEKMNQLYVELGTHRRITVPQGFVATAIDDGKPVIITPDQSPYFTDSPTFQYDPKTGLKSTQIEKIALEKLVVNTREGMPVSIIGVIQYRILNPEIAFLKVDQVHSAIKIQAESTLTSVFAQLSIDQIQTGLSSTSVTSLKDEKKEISDEHVVPPDFIHQATDLFVKEFQNVAQGLGVELKALNILSMEFTNKEFLAALQTRAKERMEASTKLANTAVLNEAEISESERKAKQVRIDTDAETKRMKELASARLDVAKKDKEAAQQLASQPLAAELAILGKHADIAKAMGDKTTFIPHGMSLGNYSLRDVRGNMVWLQPQDNHQAVQSMEQGGTNPFTLRKSQSE